MHIIRNLLLICLMVISLPPSNAAASDDSRNSNLENRIGQMLMVGFRGTEAAPDSFIIRTIRKYRLGGVILFDYDVPSGSRPRNITGPAQVKRLIRALQAAAPVSLLVAVDAEGGRINRLKPAAGFLDIPSARGMTKLSRAEVEKHYQGLAGQLAGLGINCNLAPVVDLDSNPENPVIGGLDRSFSSDPATVTALARIFIRTHRRAGVVTCLKHFPGHGSSRDDSHLGMVDVTDTWREQETRPYRALIEEDLADMVMTAHIINRRIDPRFPATLSPAHLQNRLRKDLKFRGVIISDDIQMGAVTKHFGEAEAAVRAVLAGCDILAVSNNGRTYDEKAVERVRTALLRAVADGTLPERRIDQAYARILRLKRRVGIVSDTNAGSGSYR